MNLQRGIGLHGSTIETTKFPQVLVGLVPVQTTLFYKVATICTLYVPLKALFVVYTVKVISPAPLSTILISD